MSKTKETVEPRTLKVISICSVCKEPVCATKHDKAVRHGFVRYRKRKTFPNSIGMFDEYSQEDDKPCAGTGEEVVYKRYQRFLKDNK